MCIVTTVQYVNGGREFKNPVTGKRQLAAKGVEEYGFDASGKAIYCIAKDVSGTYHFQGNRNKVIYFIRFEQGIPDDPNFSRLESVISQLEANGFSVDVNNGQYALMSKNTKQGQRLYAQVDADGSVNGMPFFEYMDSI